MFGEVVEGLGVLLLGLPNAVVVVSVYHRAEADLIENLRQEATEDPSVQNVRPGDVFI